MLFGRHIVELNATNNTLVRSYAWGLDLSGTKDGAGGVGGLAWVTLHTASGPASGTHFTCYDGNGNIVALVSATTGDVTARYEYGLFGEPIRVTGPAANLNPFRFSTKRTCNTTDLVLYEYRAYSLSLGRWISHDPMEEEGGFNLYAFVDNANLDYVDPFGERAISFEINGPQSPTGVSLFTRVALTTTTCPVEVEGSVFLAVEWQPPGLRYMEKPFGWFNVHIEAGARGGGQVKFKYSECSGLSNTKACFRFEVFARAEYRRQRVRDGGARFTRSRFGIGADGGGELCIDICNGDVTLDAAFNSYAYAHFGYKYFNRTYNWEDFYSGSWTLGNIPQAALLKDYCNKALDPNNCCCIKKYGRLPSRLLKKCLFQGKLILMIYICLPGVDWKPIFVLFSYPKCQYILPQ